MKLGKEVKAVGKEFKKLNTEFEKLVREYDRIAIFRHIMPDYDALGTQLGLYHFLKDNFPSKEIIVLGDNHVTFTPRLFQEMDRVNDAWFDKPFLAIICDVGATPRIADPRFQKAEHIVVVDHHPKVEDLTPIHLVDTSKSAAAEFMVSLLLNWKHKYAWSKESATNFYIGMVGDNGRFQYSSTNAHTFEIASFLIGCNISLNEIYGAMYLKQIDDLNVTAYILNHYKVSPKGVAYYVLDDKIQKDLKITTERGKENVNLFSNIKGINIWCSITQDTDPKEPCWRISIRSRDYVINGVAAQFGGGGHKQASGAKITTLDELPSFIAALDALID
jgi:phosphoesterase RecJ-like protein